MTASWRPKPSRWRDLFDRLVLERPWLALAFLGGLLAVCGWGLPYFRLDASGDDLVLEHDPDVRYYRRLLDRYGGGDFVVITYSPPEDLFAKPALDRLRKVRDELKALPRVASVVTLLDVPLLKNKPGPLKDLKYNIRTLESPEVDIPKAIAEFRTSPIYQHLLISEDLRSAAMQVNFRADRSKDRLSARRGELLEAEYQGTLSDITRAELSRVKEEYRAWEDEQRALRHEDIAAIRRIIAGYRAEADFILGGVPMIVDDIISFIRKDLRVFGLGMALLIMGALLVIFRRWRWVLLPLLSCALSVFAMMGLLGLLRLDVTVVSSNFVSLQLILTLSLGIHIVGHFNELLSLHPQAPNRELVREAVGEVFVPALFCQLTTIVGFGSLLACDIVPIVNFGWMMVAGLVVSMIVVFVVLPAGMALLPKPPPASLELQFGHPFTMACARLVERRRGWVLGAAAAAGLATAAGCLRLEVENSFINYFKSTTEIYRGMRFIDRNLGGTTPLDITLEFPPAAKPAPAPAGPDAEFDMFEDMGAEEDPAKYWFDTHKLETIEKVHDYLDALPETGKVLSLATVWKQSRDLNDGKPLDDFAAALLFNSLEGDFRDILVRPYVSIADDQVRITTRIKDSLEGLRRDELLKRIRRELVEKAGLKEGEFRLAGLMLLYNDMLQSLYASQIKTVSWTLLAIGLMFLLLWRSAKTALCTVAPSVVATLSILGIMGLSGTPLDMMTITVVAVSMGIAVDNATHFIHRFGREVARDGDYVRAVYRCHGTVGHNMVYTSLPIILGFSILALSNFVPSILFGLLVAFAMVAALLSNLTLLPSLVLLLKPFGSPAPAARAEPVADAPAPADHSA